MTKQQIDINKLFEQSFDDFSPKTSASFNTKMAKRIGFASLFGFTITSSLAKIGAVLKTIAFETAGLMKTAGIIKSIAVVTVVSTTVATPIIINTAEKANKEKQQQTILIEKRKAIHSDLPVLEMKTSFINLMDLETENKLAHNDLLHNNALHNKLIPIHIYRDNFQLTNIASKETTVSTDIESNHTNISQKQIKKNTKGSTSIIVEKEETVSSNITSKESSISGKTDLANNQVGKRNSTVVLGDNSKNEAIQEGTLYLKSIPYLPLRPENNSANSIYKNKLKLTTDIFEEPSDKNLFSDVLMFGEIHFMPFSYKNLSTIEPLINDTIINQFIQESPQLSYQFGFDIRVQKKQSPWFANIGINYQKVSEQVDYYFVDKTIGYWNYDTTFNYVIDPPFIDTVFHVDSAYLVQWEGKENSIIHTNSYHYLNVPIKIGYEFFKKKKFSLQVSTGVEMAIRLNSSGYLYNDRGIIINYDDVKTSASIDWYYLASFGFNYQMNKTTIFVLPSIKYQLNTNRINNYPKEHKYFVYGLKLGVRFKLF